MHPGVTGVADASTAAASASAAAGGALAAAAARFLVHDAELGIVRGGLGTILPLPLFRAVTIVIGLCVEAGRGVPARIRAAVVSVDLALITGETDRADALVSVHQISALAAVLTGFRGALVDVDVAVLAREPCGAAAVIIVDQIDAESPVLALTDAVVDVLRAILPRETAPAATPERK